MPAGWPACARAGCGGSGVYGAGADTCLAHLAEDELAAAVQHCRSEPLDARGVTLRPALLSRVLTEEPVLAQGARFDDAVFQGLAGFGRTVFEGPVTFSGARFEGDATFDRARFERGVGFEGAVFGRIAAYREATFGGPARFRGARFGGYALFETTTFDAEAVFERAAFDGVANFERAAFAGAASFESATFVGYAGFGRARFGDRTSFDGAGFNSVAWFGETRFEGGSELSFGRDRALAPARFRSLAGFERAEFWGPATFAAAEFEGEAVFERAAFGRDAGFGEVVFDLGADFERATFAGDAAFSAARFKRAGRFTRATFERTAIFDRAAFDDEAVFEAATFDGTAILGPMRVGGTVVLDFGSYRAPASVDVSAPRISCLGTRFLDGVDLRASGAELALDDARFEGGSIVAARRSAAGDGPSRPRLVSLRRAEVADLVLTDLDLSPCLFAGAQGLDRLRIEGVPRLAPAPTGWRRRGRLAWRWTPRLAIAEEHRWRARRGERGEGWNPPQCRSEWLEECESLPDQQDIGAGEVAAIYGALRDGREHAGERRAANDFHYGEMEMRRNDPERSRAERIFLSLYWLTSGYGLRRSRALGALLAGAALGRLCSIFLDRRDASA